MPGKAITKEERHAKFQEEHWQHIGGIVSDVMNVLETTAREINRKGSNADPLSPRQVRQVQMVMLTATHALAPVLEALNDESRSWFGRNPENFDTREEINEAIKRGDIVG
jgi:hypothetical protein